MATIFEMIRRRQGEFHENPTRAAQNMSMAIAAVKEGMRSKAWEYYMSQFIDKSLPGLSQDQLARLKATDETEGDPIMDRHRAYLVANAMCGPSTVPDFHIGCLSIDNGLETVVCSQDVFECETTTVGALNIKQAVRRQKASKSSKYSKKKSRG